MKIIKEEKRLIRPKKISTKSIRNSKIDIKVSDKDITYRISSLLKSVGINIDTFKTIIMRIMHKGNTKVRWLLNDEEYKLIKKYSSLLSTFGLQSKQIAYLMGNQITASVIGRYIKDALGEEFSQKPITTYFIKKDTHKRIILKPRDYKDKKTIEELLDTEVVFYKFGTLDKISLKNTKRNITMKSRKK